jgi:D-amino-acid dehydrogenase
VSSPQTIVVGAGIVGVSAAYYLAKRGHRVTVLDRADFGDSASSGNAGIVAFGHPPLPRPGLIAKLLKWMLDRSSPLYVPPRLDPAMIRWFWQFRRACTESRFRDCMEILSALGHESKACFDEIMSEQDMTCEYHRGGWLEVFRTEEGMAEGRRVAELLDRHGFEVAYLNGRELKEREPAFKDGVVGAVHSVDSSFTDPNQFLVALAGRAQAHGAVIRTNAELMDVLVRDGRFAGVRIHTDERIEADTLVLACGIWTTRLARQIGIKVPMQAGKGYHRNLTRPTPCVSAASVLAEKHVAVTPLAGVLRLSGTVEFSGINQKLVQRRLDMLTAAAREYLRGIGQTQTVSEWCGLRPCTSDGLPVVGWAPHLAGVFVATGHARMGFTLGPVTGRLASECILDGRPSIDITPLRVDRFDPAGRRTPSPRREPSPGPAAGSRA